MRKTIDQVMDSIITNNIKELYGDVQINVELQGRYEKSIFIDIRNNEGVLKNAFRLHLEENVDYEDDLQEIVDIEMTSSNQSITTKTMALLAIFNTMKDCLLIEGMYEGELY